MYLGMTIDATAREQEDRGVAIGQAACRTRDAGMTKLGVTLLAQQGDTPFQ